MPEMLQDRINELALDICRLRTELEWISRRGDPAARPTEAEQSRRRYDELLQRMRALPLDREDRSLIDALLKPVRTQLRLLR